MTNDRQIQDIQRDDQDPIHSEIHPLGETPPKGMCFSFGTGSGWNLHEASHKAFRQRLFRVAATVGRQSFGTCDQKAPHASHHRGFCPPMPRLRTLALERARSLPLPRALGRSWPCASAAWPGPVASAAEYRLSAAPTRTPPLIQEALTTLRLIGLLRHLKSSADHDSKLCSGRFAAFALAFHSAFRDKCSSRHWFRAVFVATHRPAPQSKRPCVPRREQKHVVVEVLQPAASRQFAAGQGGARASRGGKPVFEAAGSPRARCSGMSGRRPDRQPSLEKRYFGTVVFFKRPAGHHVRIRAAQLFRALRPRVFLTNKSTVGTVSPNHIQGHIGPRSCGFNKHA